MTAGKRSSNPSRAGTMPDRYFCNDLTPECVKLPPDEARHACKVMRLQIGDELTLFDGAGMVADAVIDSIHRNDVTALIRRRVRSIPKRSPAIIAAVSAPKGDRLKWMVEKLTELGTDSFIPLKTERGIRDPGEGQLDRLSATVINASKQSGRDHLMTIAPCQSIAEVLADHQQSHHLWLAHPGGSDSMLPPASLSSLQLKSHIVFIGPEGGFTSSEYQSIRDAKAELLSWPDSVLRIETAAIMATVVLKSAVMMSPGTADGQLATPKDGS